MSPNLRITDTVARVLRAFLENPDRGIYGFEIMQNCHISSGSLYPILIRLERAGWIALEVEDIDPRTEGRPPRKYYTLTPVGATAARDALEEFTTRWEKLGERLRLPATEPAFRPDALGGYA